MVAMRDFIIVEPPCEISLSRPAATFSPAPSGGEGSDRRRPKVHEFNARAFARLILSLPSTRTNEKRCPALMGRRTANLLGLAPRQN